MTTTMRPIRSIATALLIAGVALVGCGRSQPDQTAPPADQPPAATAAPATKAPTPAGGTDSQPVVVPNGRTPSLSAASTRTGGRSAST
jgi:hypothetical protein